jgi:hypothetical protein
VTTHQICPSRRHTRPPGTAIICNRCRATVVITAEGRVPEHTVQCQQQVHHGMWPDRCSRNAISGGYCRQHGGVA